MNTDNSIFQNKSSRMESMSKQLGFDIPVESVSLPSQGKLYPSDHPFAGTDGVEVRSMTAREEDLLTSKALIKAGTMINKLVESCLVNKSVDVGTLLMGDRNALLVAIRVIGYGAEYKTKMRCQDCDEQFEHTFRLDKLSIKPLGAEPESPNQNVFSYTLPMSKFKVTFKLLTCADERDMTLQDERKRKSGSQVENRVTTRLFHSIISINGEDDRGKISTIVNNLRAGDSRALRGYMDKIEPQIDMVQEVKCKHCGETSEVDVPIGTTFFWPEFN